MKPSWRSLLLRDVLSLSAAAGCATVAWAILDAFKSTGAAWLTFVVLAASGFGTMILTAVTHLLVTRLVLGRFWRHFHE